MGVSEISALVVIIYFGVVFIGLFTVGLIGENKTGEERADLIGALIFWPVLAAILFLGSIAYSPIFLGKLVKKHIIGRNSK